MFLKSSGKFIIGYKTKKVNNPEDKLYNVVVSQLRIVVENFIGKMKWFKCLS